MTASHCLRAACLVLGLALAGCAGEKETPIRAMWQPPPAWWQVAAREGGALQRRDGTLYRLEREAARNLAVARDEIQRASGLDFAFLIADWDSPNAFADDERGKPIVVFSTALIRLIGRDLDAVSYVMGHEVAHHKLGHNGETRKDRERTTWVASQVLGNIAGMIVPFGGYVVGPAVTGIGRSFTRDEERDADALGLEWATGNGRDPCGAFRLSDALARVGRDPFDLPFLSTHPGHEERMASADALSLRLRGRRCADAPR
jgi:predicted Zn-dependent protease